MTILLSLITGAIIAYAGLYISQKYGILDDPRRAKVYQRPRIPTVQGVTLFLAFVLIIVTNAYHFPINGYVRWMIIGSACLVLMSAIEVYINMSALLKLILQFIIVAVVVWLGGLDTEIITLGSYTIEFGKIIGTLVSFVWFILCVNAINRFDGIEGQTSGVASVGYLTIRGLITRVIIPQYPNITARNELILATVQHVSIILAILSAIYTIIESKQKGLLRDAGTYFYGFTIAYLSLLGGAKIGMLVVVFSLVIFDAIRVIAYRVFIMKKNPFKGDLTHIHHRLLALGWSRSEVRAFVWIRSASMAVLMLLQGSNSLSKLIIFALMASIFYGINTYLYLIKKKDPVYQLDKRVKKILQNPVYRNNEEEEEKQTIVEIHNKQ